MRCVCVAWGVSSVVTIIKVPFELGNSLHGSSGEIQQGRSTYAAGRIAVQRKTHRSSSNTLVVPGKPRGATKKKKFYSHLNSHNHCGIYSSSHSTPLRGFSTMSLSKPVPFGRSFQLKKPVQSRSKVQGKKKKKEEECPPSAEIRHEQVCLCHNYWMNFTYYC